MGRKRGFYKIYFRRMRAHVVSPDAFLVFRLLMADVENQYASLLASCVRIFPDIRIQRASAAENRESILLFLFLPVGIFCASGIYEEDS